MKKLVLMTSAVFLSACGQDLPNYAEMSPEQKHVFMANYTQDMNKVYAGANRSGKIRILVTGDAKNDTIKTTMNMPVEMKGLNKAMADQISAGLLEQNCKDKFYKEYVDAGITFRMVMKDTRGKTVVNTVVSPRKCEQYLKA